MIRLDEVQFSYVLGQTILANVSLEIGPGLTLVLGPNGSGKTTLLRIVAGIERPDSGHAEIDGYDLWKEEVAARRHLAYVPEHPDVTPYATIRDVLGLVCRLRSMPLEAGMDAANRARLSGFLDRSIRELSMGQRRRALLAAAWIGAPRVVILDEPLEAMDRAIREEILAWVDRLLRSGGTVVIATHQIEPFAESTTRALATNEGTWTVVEPLPADHLERRALLESLSRNG